MSQISNFFNKCSVHVVRVISFFFFIFNVFQSQQNISTVWKIVIRALLLLLLLIFDWIASLVWSGYHFDYVAITTNYVLNWFPRSLYILTLMNMKGIYINKELILPCFPTQRKWQKRVTGSQSVLANKLSTFFNQSQISSLRVDHTQT